MSRPLHLTGFENRIYFEKNCKFKSNNAGKYDFYIIKGLLFHENIQN